MPIDSILYCLRELRFLTQGCFTKYQRLFDLLNFTDLPINDFIKFIKMFEQFGEAVPQLLISVTFYVQHISSDPSLDQKEYPGIPFKIPQTLITMLLSAGCVVMGVGTSLEAARKMYNQGFKGKDGRVPLHGAAALGDGKEAYRKVKILIEEGARLDPRDNNHDTPFILAARKGNTEVITLLVQKGLEMFNVNNQGGGGDTALTIAARSKFFIVKFHHYFVAHSAKK